MRRLLFGSVLAVACRAPQAVPPLPPTEPDVAQPDAESGPVSQADPQPDPEPDTPPEPEGLDSSGPVAIAPLDETQRRLFLGTPEDKAAKVRQGHVKALYNKHYLAGNEWSLYAFYERIKDLGGGYMGVGPDQAYLFIGWQRPRYAWLVDYDASVKQVHAMYRAFFLATDTPKEFLKLFGDKHKARGIEIINAAFKGRERNAMRHMFTKYRTWFRWRLIKVARRCKKAGIPSFLTDQGDYDYVRDLIRNDRVRPMLANLLEKGAVEALATAAHELRVPVRVLYLSNAEEYWKTYGAQYKVNVQALPIDDRSVVLRTLLTWGVNKDYRYIAQTTHNYLAWLSAPYIKNVDDIVHSPPKAVADKVNFHEIEGEPIDSPAAKATKS